MIVKRQKTVVVIGNGMVGHRFCERLTELDVNRDYQIVTFCEEPRPAYDRVNLTKYFQHRDAGKLALARREWYEEHGIQLFVGDRATELARSYRVVRSAQGREVPYDNVVLATGSAPFVPPVPGVEKKGVFVYRTIEDLEQIIAYAQNVSRAAVIGGGLLGLEAAKAAYDLGLETHVVEFAPRLMPRQLDDAGSKALAGKIAGLGVQVHLNKNTSAILGNGKVEGLSFADGSGLDVQMVIVSAGIKPRDELARACGLNVGQRGGVVVDDYLRTSDPEIYALGEVALHGGMIYGLSAPGFEMAEILAANFVGQNRAFQGGDLSTKLKLLGVDVATFGNYFADEMSAKLVVCENRCQGTYKKLLFTPDGTRLLGGMLVGDASEYGQLALLAKNGQQLPEGIFDLHAGESARDALLEAGGSADLTALPDDTQICNCHRVPKGRIVAAVREGMHSLDSVGECTRAGTGCGTCQPLLSQLINAYGPNAGQPPAKNKIEVMKEEKDGLDCLSDVLQHAPTNNWEALTEDDKHRAKWHGLFFRKPTPGHFMLRIRFQAGRGNSRQLRVIADLSDEFGKGFVDLTTRQQIQMRWFTLADVEEIWRRLADVGLETRQTGMDNVRGVCGCPVAGLTPHELLDATPMVDEFTKIIVGNKEFTNLPRKFNVTITGCLENCCHTETQDIAMVPAVHDSMGRLINGFNVLIGGKQGSGGYRPATPLDIFTPPEDAAQLAAEITRIFRDFGPRSARNRARLAFLIEDRGIKWYRRELEKRWGSRLLKAGADARKKHHVDHVGINPQKSLAQSETPPLHYVGLSVPVGRLTTAQLRAVAALADVYGNGEVRVTPGQNLIVPNVPERRISALTSEPIFNELPYDPSPIMRGLVACTGIDYCPLALIDTKGWALKVAKELEQRLAGRRLLPLTIHWSGCPAGCGLHQVATIGLQGCRTKLPNGEIVDAAHVCIGGKTGTNPVVAKDVMYDVPCERLSEALEPLASYLPR
ncbi:MAG TPA: FAD-dependent oxidoreductase [Gemmataceae bacterium]|jgi:nitrite reductase (NADH) large subunit|nr:FAD-dependent oxidoreductase [Gemmataceae bacterium]